MHAFQLTATSPLCPSKKRIFYSVIVCKRKNNNNIKYEQRITTPVHCAIFRHVAHENKSQESERVYSEAKEYILKHEWIPR